MHCEVRHAACVEKPLEEVLPSATVGCGRVSVNPQGGMKGVRLMESSGVAPLCFCRLLGGELKEQ